MLYPYEFGYRFTYLAILFKFSSDLHAFNFILFRFSFTKFRFDQYLILLLVVFYLLIL